MSYTGNYRGRGSFQQRTAPRLEYGGRYGQKPQNNYGRRNFNGRGGGYQSNYPPRQNNYGGSSGRPDTPQLWMGDLDPSWTDESILSIWKTLGENPTLVKMMRDKNDPSRVAYCFVNFASHQDVVQAMHKNGNPVPGTNRVFKLNYASGGGAGGATSAPGDAYKGTKNDNSLFVGDLAPEVTEQVLFARFNTEYPEQVGLVKIMYDAATKASKGFGFIRFNTAEAQKRALAEMNGAIVGSRPIRLGLAAGSGSGTSTLQAIAPETSELSKIHIAQPQPSLSQYTDANNTTLVVRGLSSRTSPDELAAYFISFGDIIYCTLSPDRNEGYVKFFLRSAAENALMFMYGAIINDCNVKVAWGKNIEADSTDINVRHQPGQGAYTKATAAPPIYGTPAGHSLQLDQLSKEQAAHISFIDASDMSDDKINQRYIEAKIHRNKLLEL